MRIRKLGLRRYGKFTDGVIDFGERSAGAPDLHIVYGPNEAGKSTAMSACMDLFYGIHHQPVQLSAPLSDHADRSRTRDLRDCP